MRRFHKRERAAGGLRYRASSPVSCRERLRLLGFSMVAYRLEIARRGHADSRVLESRSRIDLERVPNIEEQTRMPLSKDPARRAKQLGNLRPVGASTHGATSERKLAPLREQHRTDLMRRFPALDDHRLSLLSDLLARCDLARDFIDVRGLMRNTREPHPVLELLSRWERRAWDMLRDLQPARQPAMEPPESIMPELLDPEVQEASRKFLQVAGKVRARRLASEKAAKAASK